MRIFRMKLTEEQIKNVHYRMLTGEIKSELNKEYEVYPSFFSKAFKKLDLEVPKGAPRVRTYGDYFDNISSEDKSYLLGILFTDGWIKKPSAQKHQIIIGLEVEETDKALIEYFNSKIKPKGSVMTIKCNSYGKRIDGTIPIHCRTTVYSNWMANTLLTKYNFCYSKSQATSLSLPKVDYPFSFIRGLLDGDGTVAVYGRSTNCVNYYIGFVSISNTVVIDLANLIQSLCPFKLNFKFKERPDDKYLTRYSFKLTKRRDVLWLASNMYSNFEFGLERKLNRFKELSNTTLKYSYNHSKETIRYANTVLSSKVMFRTSAESNA